LVRAKELVKWKDPRCFKIPKNQVDFTFLNRYPGGGGGITSHRSKKNGYCAVILTLPVTKARLASRLLRIILDGKNQTKAIHNSVIAPLHR
jgi:hypothetical protein